MPLHEFGCMRTKCSVQLCIATACTVVPAITHDPQSLHTNLQGRCAGSECSTQKTGLWIHVSGEEASACLTHLANRHHINELSKAKSLKAEHAFSATKALHFIVPHWNTSSLACLHQCQQEFTRGNIEAAFTLHQFHDEARMLTWIAVDVLL